SSGASVPPNEMPRTSTWWKPRTSRARTRRRARPHRRRGSAVAGDPPAPGTSMAMVSTPSSRARNGANSSSPAPMPLMSSSGRPRPEPSIDTRRRTPSTSTNSTVVILARALVDVATGGAHEGRMGRASRLARGFALGAGAGAQPLGPVRPPRAAVRLARGEPRLRVGDELVVGEVARLGGGRRVDQRLDVSAAAGEENLVAAEELRRAVAGVPRGDVVGERA